MCVGCINDLYQTWKSPRKVSKCLKCHHIQYFEEEYTIQYISAKLMMYKILHREQKRLTNTHPTKPGGAHMFSGSGIRHVTIDTNQEISHEWGLWLRQTEHFNLSHLYSAWNISKIQKNNRRFRQNRYPLTHKYMIAHFPAFTHVL